MADNNDSVKVYGYTDNKVKKEVYSKDEAIEVTVNDMTDAEIDEFINSL